MPSLFWLKMHKKRAMLKPIKIGLSMTLMLETLKSATFFIHITINNLWWNSYKSINKRKSGHLMPAILKKL